MIDSKEEVNAVEVGVRNYTLDAVNGKISGKSGGRRAEGIHFY